jgi:hypothetical protein
MGKEMGFHNGHAGSICEGGSALYSSCEGSSQVGVAHETSMSMTYLSRFERQAGPLCDVLLPRRLCGRRGSSVPSRPGEFRPEPPHRTVRMNREVPRLVPPHEGCRLPLFIGFLPLPVDPIQMAMACFLRSAGITPASSLLQSSPPLTGASVLSASRLAPLAPFPLASPCRFSRSIQEPGRASRRLHAGCRSGRLRHPPS